MQSRLLVNFILFAFVAALILVVYNSSEQDVDENNKLTTINPDNVDRISIKHKQRTVVLKKNQNHWKIVQPLDIAANDFRIGTLLKILDAASHAQYRSADLDLSDYGLANSKTSITFNDTTIAFGIVNPVNDYRYVMTGDHIHLIDDYYYPLLSSQLGTLVSLNPLPADASIIKLVLPEQIIQKNEQGLWQSSKKMSGDAIVETVQNWKNIQAFGVHDYLKRESTGDIEIYLEGEDKPLRFVISDTDPWLIIGRPELGLEYHYDIENYARLLQPGSTEQSSGNTAE